MTLEDFCKKYDKGSKYSNFLELDVDSKQYLFSVTIGFDDSKEPEYNIHSDCRYVSIGKLTEFKEQVNEAYDLLKSYDRFLSELRLSTELTEEQEATLESIVHALA